MIVDIKIKKKKLTLNNFEIVDMTKILDLPKERIDELLSEQDTVNLLQSRIETIEKHLISMMNST
jgi:hypothetical protein